MPLHNRLKPLKGYRKGQWRIRMANSGACAFTETMLRGGTCKLLTPTKENCNA